MASPLPTLPPGLAARFEVVDKIGRGSFGTVMRVRDRELSRVVALKLLEPTEDAAMLSRFEREAAALARVKHPHVLQVYAHGVEDRQPFLVMELLQGRTFENLAGGTDPLDAMLPVADALAVVHQAGMVHRDVKPANLFMTEAGRPVLLDFGLVLVPAATRITLPNLLVGTLAFVSPEVLQGGKVDAGEDWYAWGASLFWLYERRTHRSTEALLASAQGHPTPPIEFSNPALPPKVRALLRAMLDWPAADRVGGPAAIRGFLEAETGDRSFATPPVAASLAGGPAPGRRVPPGAVLAGIALGLALGIGFLGAGRGGAASAPGDGSPAPPGPARAPRTLPAPPGTMVELAREEAKAAFAGELPTQVSGWLAGAILAGRGLAAKVAALEAEVTGLAGSGRPTEGPFGGRQGVKVLALGGFDAFVEGLLAAPDAREGLEAWMGGATAEYRGMLDQAALAVATDPGRADLAVALVREPALRFRQVGWLAFPACRAEACMADPGPEPEALYLDGLAMRLAAEGRQRAGLDPTELARAAAARLAAAAVPDPARPKAMRPVCAALDRIAVLELLPERAAMVDAWAGCAVPVLALGRLKAIGTALAPVLRAIEEGRPGRLAEPDMAPTVAWVGKRRDKLEKEAWGLSLLARFDRLLAGRPPGG